LLLTEWVQWSGRKLDERLATALLVGLATDTGWFRFSNADARTLHTAGELVSAGARPSEIYDDIYQRDSAAKLRLVARLLQSLELGAGGRLAVLRLRQADFAAAGADMSETEDLVNEVNRLGCAEATVMFTEEPEGVIRVNLRSKRVVDVAKLAQQFGGGGHVRAAGARVKGDWDETVAAVMAAAERAISSSA
jgi:phosphoesterase RecJ-like protein